MELILLLKFVFKLCEDFERYNRLSVIIVKAISQIPHPIIINIPVK